MKSSAMWGYVGMVLECQSTFHGRHGGMIAIKQIMTFTGKRETHWWFPKIGGGISMFLCILIISDIQKMMKYSNYNNDRIKIVAGNVPIMQLII